MFPIFGPCFLLDGILQPLRKCPLRGNRKLKKSFLLADFRPKFPLRRISYSVDAFHIYAGVCKRTFLSVNFKSFWVLSSKISAILWAYILDPNVIICNSNNLDIAWINWVQYGLSLVQSQGSFRVNWNETVFLVNFGGRFWVVWIIVWSRSTKSTNFRPLCRRRISSSVYRFLNIIWNFFKNTTNRGCVTLFRLIGNYFFRTFLLDGFI